MAPRRPAQSLVTDLPDTAVTFDIDQFDNAIRSHGATLVHYRAMRCPVGLIDPHDTRRPHDDHSGCSNGYLYTRAGEMTCLFTGNGLSSSPGEVGLMDSASVSITMPRHYDGTEKPVYVAPFDRLYLLEQDIVVPDWQIFTTNGIKDKMRFPVVTVHDIVDRNNVRYEPGDYVIDDGQISWVGSHRPGLDPESGKGLVCSIRFTYRPYWYVKSMPHEIRVHQADNVMTGERMVFRMPQAAQLQREYVFEKNDNDEQAPDKPRQVQPPIGPRFGPR